MLNIGQLANWAVSCVLPSAQRKTKEETVLIHVCALHVGVWLLGAGVLVQELCGT